MRNGFPRPVELPPETCQDCHGERGGEVIVGGWEMPSTRWERCQTCGGTGEIRPTCIVCHEPATTLVWDGKRREEFCTACAAPCPDDDVISFALTAMP